MEALVDLRNIKAILREEGAQSVIRRLERHVKLAPQHAPAHIMLAKAYEAQNQLEAARKAWTRATYWAPGSATAEKGLKRVLNRKISVSHSITRSVDDAEALGFENIDSLIDELESARIEPSPDMEEAPEPEFDDDLDDMVSETLGRIYTSQGEYADAARVYLKLAEQNPERAKSYRKQAEELRDMARKEKEEDQQNP